MKKILILFIFIIIIILLHFSFNKKEEVIYNELKKDDYQIKINGDYVNYVNIDSDYKEEGARVYSSSGDTYSDVSISYYNHNRQVSHIDTRYVDNYLVIYKAKYNGKTIKANRIVLVSDTKAPTFDEIDTKTISSLEAATYDVSEGVRAIDNFSKVNISCDNSLSILPGNYVISCKAIDINGNASVKKKLVKVIKSIEFEYDNKLKIKFPTDKNYDYKFSIDGGENFINCSSEEELDINSGSVIASVYLNNQFIMSNTFVIN